MYKFFPSRFSDMFERADTPNDPYFMSENLTLTFQWNIRNGLNRRKNSMYKFFCVVKMTCFGKARGKTPPIQKKSQRKKVAD
jgi:hypothetical protein